MVVRAAVLFVVFVVASAALARAQRAESLPARQSLAAFPMTIDGWHGRVDPPLTEKELAVLGADDHLLRTYFGPGEAASLYIGYWNTQKRGDTVHSPLNCLPGSGWQPLNRRPLQIAVSGASAPSEHIEVNRYVIQKGLDRQLVLYWYQSHGRVVASEYWGKVYLVADAIRLGRSDTAIVRVVTSINDASAAAERLAEQRAVKFVQRIFPVLPDYIPS